MFSPQLLIETYGYPAIGIGVIFEPEVAALLGGFAAHQGLLHFGKVFLLTVVMSIISDQFLFFVGRTKGRVVLQRFPRLHAKMEKMHDFLDRNQRWIVFLLRFAYGFRLVLPLALGTSRVSARKFMILNILSAIIWASIFTSIGYLLGASIEQTLGRLERAQDLILALFALLFLTAFGVHLFGDKIKGLFLRKGGQAIDK